MAGSVDLCWPDVCLLLFLLLADDGGQLRCAHAVQVQVDLAGPLDRAPRVRGAAGRPAAEGEL